MASVLAYGCTCSETTPPSETSSSAVGVMQSAPKVPPLPNGCLPQPSDATPATLTLPGGGRIRVSAYGRDMTDDSNVSWNQPYPSPCLDDRPPRKGFPNAAWHADYSVEGTQLCLNVDALYAQYPPKNQLQIGYTVQLAGGLTFEDGQTRKQVAVLEFMGVPTNVEGRKCVTLKLPSAPAVPSASGSAIGQFNPAPTPPGRPKAAIPAHPTPTPPSGTAR